MARLDQWQCAQIARRGLEGIEQRAQLLHAYEQWREPTHIDFGALVDARLVATHWENWETVLEKIKEAQAHADDVHVQLGALISTTKKGY